MTNKQQERKVALKNIIEGKGNFASQVNILSGHDWDFEEQAVTLDKTALQNYLQYYLSGSLTEEDVYKWADFLEVREDVDYPEDEEKIISEIMHALATPELEGPLTKDRARIFVSRL